MTLLLLYLKLLSVFSMSNSKSISNPTISSLLDENGTLKDELNTYKKLSSEVKLNEQRLALALRGANDGLWDWDLETDKVYYSPRWKSMLGYDEHELDNTLETWASLVHSDEKISVLTKVKKYLSGEKNSFETEMRIKHKEGHFITVLSRAFLQLRESDAKPIRLIGTHVDITQRINAEEFNKKTSKILEMVALGQVTSDIYNAIALLFESRHIGLRCSMLELKDGCLMHGGAPSLPKEYCDAVHGLKNGPNVGSCGASTFTGERCIVENIETHQNWATLKEFAIPHGMKSCWSEPIKDCNGLILGAFGMYYNFPASPNEEESQDLIAAARLAGIVMQRDHDQKRIHELAYTDVLTGVANRAHFYHHVDNLIKASKRHHRKFSLLYIDLDNFKEVNDTLGHDAGDSLLKEISSVLSSVSRDIDFLARLSGDEFCMVAEEIEDSYTSSHIAQRCFDAIFKPINLSGRQYKSTCSIGIAHYPDDGDSLKELLKSADTALYSAKELGKNRYAYYEPELTLKAEYQYKFEKLLKEAIENQKLSLVYQPQVNAENGKIIGVEALSRWYDEELGHVSPVEFIKVAERIGLIKPLTEWVLRTACNQAISWQKKGHPAIRLAINISPSHLIEPDIVDLIKDVLKESGLNARLLELEVTENITQTDVKNLLILEQLKKIGVELAIDDFGIGYSSFASIKHLNVHHLKIDRYFIKGIKTDKDSKLLISTMIDLAHNLGIEIIAEGVETRGQLEFLQQSGCKTIQGFFFSKPVDCNELDKLLKKESLLT